MKNLNLATVFAVFRYDHLLEVDPDSIYSDSLRITSPSADIIQVEFTAQRKSQDTKVYQIEVFRYWSSEDRSELKEW